MPRRFRKTKIALSSLAVDRARVYEPFTAAPVAYTGWHGVAAALGVD